MNVQELSQVVERRTQAATRHVTIGGEGHGPVSGILAEPSRASCLLVLGHGAGAPMTHPFMEGLAAALVAEKIAVLRYNFAYSETGRRLPDPRPRLLAVVASALKHAGRVAETPLFAGGKSMGGRMTSLLAARRASDRAAGADEPPFGVAGLVFFGFPLHGPGRPGLARAAHLADVRTPMLFHQGTRDRLADAGLIRRVVDEAGPRAALHVVEDADHSFNVPKRSGRTAAGVIAALAARTAEWVRDVLDEREVR